MPATAESIGRLLCIAAIVIRLVYLSPDLRIEPSLRLSILTATTLAQVHASVSLGLLGSVQVTWRVSERSFSPLSFEDSATCLRPPMEGGPDWPLSESTVQDAGTAVGVGKWASGIRPSTRQGTEDRVNTRETDVPKAMQ